MKGKWTKWTAVVVACWVGLVLSGCACLQREAPAKPAAIGEGPACPIVTRKAGKTHVAMAFPTGNTKTSVILLEKISPAEIRVGQPFEYTIDVTNLTNCKLDDVVVTDQLPDMFELKGSQPQARVSAEGEARWAVGTIDGEETKTIRVSGVAKKTGEVTHCAKVEYRTNLCLTVNVVEPKLHLVKTAPAEALLCDDIPVRLVVSNLGSGSAQNVQVVDTLPEGLMTTDGKNRVAMDIGQLGAGESRELTFVAKANRTGTFRNSAKATGEGGLMASAETSTIVRQPVLTIAKTGPDNRFVGRPLDYVITVANRGDAPAANLVVQDPLPVGTSLVKASDNGMLQGGRVTWTMERLDPGQSKTLSLMLRADSIGTVRNVATATAVCAAPVSATAQTVVAGVPAILLEVIDLDDPIEVGAKETYVIVVTNQGSAPGTNITVTGTFEDSMNYVSSSGPTIGTLVGRSVKFAPLPSLGPKEKATYRVVVEAAKTGDTRFNVSLSSDQLTRTVDETEATNIY